MGCVLLGEGGIKVENKDVGLVNEGLCGFFLGVGWVFGFEGEEVVGWSVEDGEVDGLDVFILVGVEVWIVLGFFILELFLVFLCFLLVLLWECVDICDIIEYSLFFLVFFEWFFLDFVFLLWLWMWVVVFLIFDCKWDWIVWVMVGGGGG